jgi:hypothetical protein
MGGHRIGPVGLRCGRRGVRPRVAWSIGSGSGRRSRVESRARTLGGGGRVGRDRRPVVSGGWRDAIGRARRAVRALPVVRRARGDRADACRSLRGAGDRTPSRSFPVGDLGGARSQRFDAQRRVPVPRDDGAVACRPARAASQARQARGQRRAPSLCAGPSGRRREAPERDLGRPGRARRSPRRGSPGGWCARATARS